MPDGSLSGDQHHNISESLLTYADPPTPHSENQPFFLKPLSLNPVLSEGRQEGASTYQQKKWGCGLVITSYKKKEGLHRIAVKPVLQTTIPFSMILSS